METVGDTFPPAAAAEIISCNTNDSRFIPRFRPGTQITPVRLRLSFRTAHESQNSKNPQTPPEEIEVIPFFLPL